MAVNDMLGWLQETITETVGQVAQCQSQMRDQVAQCGDCCGDCYIGNVVGKSKACNAELAMSRRPAPVFNEVDWLSGNGFKSLSSEKPYSNGGSSCDGGSTVASFRESSIGSLPTDSSFSTFSICSDDSDDEVPNEHSEDEILDEHSDDEVPNEQSYLNDWYETAAYGLGNQNVVSIDEFYNINTCKSLPPSGGMDGQGHKVLASSVVNIDDYASDLNEGALKQTLSEWYEAEANDLGSKQVISIDEYCNAIKCESQLDGQGPEKCDNSKTQYYFLDDHSESEEHINVSGLPSHTAPLPMLLGRIGRNPSCCDDSSRNKVSTVKADSSHSSNAASPRELQTKSTPLPTLLGRIGSGNRSCGGHSCSDKVQKQGESEDKLTTSSSEEDNALVLQRQLDSLSTENASLREKLGELESIRTKLANDTGDHVASQVRQCSELLRRWAATIIQSAERARVARRRAAVLQKVRDQAKAKNDVKATPAAPAKGTAPQKGRGKGAPPPPKPAPGGKGKPMPIKADVVPSVPLKKLFWNPINLAAGNDEHNTVWGKIHKVGASFDESELETLFADMPSRADKQNTSAELQEQKPKIRQVLDEKRRRQIWFMMALLPDQNRLMDAIWTMDDAVLDSDKVDLLVSNLPTPEEEEVIRDTVLEEGEVWDATETFLTKLSTIPQYALRLQVWGFLNAFSTNFSHLSTSCDDLQEACEVLQKSPSIEKLLALILYVGNYLNGGTPRGRADGFDMDTLTKLSQLKSSHQGVKGTLIDFIVKQMEEDNAGMLSELFASKGAYHVLNRARGHKMNESKDQLVGLIRQAEEHLQKINSHAGSDKVLSDRKEQLIEQRARLCNLKDSFDKLEKMYAELCAWFCFDTKKLNPTDKFFDQWNTFLVDVKKSKASLEKDRRAGSKSYRQLDGSSSVSGASKSITSSRFLSSFK